MKKLQCSILIVCILMIFTFSLYSCDTINSKGNTNLIEGITYSLAANNSFYIVTSISENSSLTDIVIPETYENLPVKEIGCSAFANNHNIVSVTLPNSIELINSKAFYNCTNLKDIVISDSVKQIGDEAFSGCKSITNLIIGNGVEAIGESTFSLCSNLVSVTVGESVRNIGSFAFFGCYKLVEVQNLSKLRVIVGDKDKGMISYYALNVYSNTIGNSKLKVTDDGFLFYKDGMKIYMLGTINGIGEYGVLKLPNDFDGEHYELYPYAFYVCGDLKKVVLGKTLTYIPEAAFSNCDNLETVLMNENIKNIEKNAFNSCCALKELVFPNSVVMIGEAAFKNCDSLTELSIPASITKIEKEAFAECDSLEKAIVNCKTIGESGFADCKELSYVTVGNDTLTIESFAFAGCEFLTDVILGTSLILIEDFAFAECDNLSNAEFMDAFDWYCYNPNTHKDQSIPDEDYWDNLKMALHLSDDSVFCRWVKNDN